MKTTQILSIATLLALSVPAFAAQGGSESHGGDAIRCAKSPENAFEGIYSLDYLSTYDRAKQNSDIVQVSSWEESQTRLRRLIAEKIPGWLASFDDFVSALDNTEDVSRSRIWRSAPSGLVDLSDEQMIRRLPKNCQKPDAEGRINAIQAVIRQQYSKIVYYDYDHDIVAELRDRPTQYSFLLVHEWLWDMTKDVRTIRLVNRMLHSRTLETQSTLKIMSYLERLGFATADMISDYRTDSELLLLKAALTNDLELLEQAIAREANGRSVFNKYTSDDFRIWCKGLELPDQNPCAIDDMRPLPAAVVLGHNRLIPRLIQVVQKRVDVNDAIATALRVKNFEAAAMLSANVLDQDKLTYEAWSVIEQLLKNGTPEELKRALEIFPEAKARIIALAPSIGTVQNVTYLASQGADFKARGKAEGPSYYYSSLISTFSGKLLERDAFLAAALSMNLEVLRYLALNGAGSARSTYTVEVKHDGLFGSPGIKQMSIVEIFEHMSHDDDYNSKNISAILEAITSLN